MSRQQTQVEVSTRVESKASDSVPALAINQLKVFKERKKITRE